jgi:hypothetical protein
MSKVYMIFLFLLSGIVQLSYADQSQSPKAYGTEYFFEDGRFCGALQLEGPSMTTIWLEEVIPGELSQHSIQQNIYNISVAKNGTCSLTFLSLIVTENGRFLESINIHGVGICQTDQAVIRWHIKPEQTVDKVHSYDFVFVRDPEQVITEENLNQILPVPIVGYDLL